MAPAEPGRGLPPGFRPSRPMLLPLREQVRQALTLLTVPAAPQLIAAVHEAFFSGTIPSAGLAGMRREEERSFRAAPFDRPYYLCAALIAGPLSAARGLLAVSTWPLERRVIGPLSRRADYLTAAIAVAESIQRASTPTPAARRLLRRFAGDIPGAAGGAGEADPVRVAGAAESEREVDAGADLAARRAWAERARARLDDAQQLFGMRPQAIPA